MVRNRYATYRFIRDVQGSVRLVVDAATGAIAQRLDYDTFGNVLLDTNPGFQPFGFQSGLYDSDTALVQFGARWYDAASGRWLSKDPILLEGGLNLYVFCGNDPVNFADPWGMCEEGSLWNQYSQNYGSILNDLYGEDLEWADTLGLWGLGSLAIEGGLSAYQSLVESLAAEQIANAQIAGALGGGGIWQRMGNAAAGARVAGRTAALRTGMQAVSKITAVVGVGATGYSIGARVNAATRALYQTWQNNRVSP